MIAEGKGGGVNRLAKEPHSYGHPPRQPETLQSAGSLRKPYRVLVVKRGRRWPPTLCGNCDTACKGGDHRTSEYDNVGAHKHACTLLDLLSSVPMLTLCARFAFCHELSRIAASMQAGGSRAPVVEVLSGSDAFCVQLLRAAFVRECWDNLD